MRTLLASLLVLVFIGASTQCLADCATDVTKAPPCHQHTQHKCSVESQLTAANPDAGHFPADLAEPIHGLLQAPVLAQFHRDDFRFELAAQETRPLLTILRI